MQAKHLPIINARYWVAILLASIAGTNLGDLYAHDSGLGMIGGLPVLAVLVAIAFLIERRDASQHEVWYWAAILVIRTGATNIADFLSFRTHLLPPPVLMPIWVLFFGILIAFFGRLAARQAGGNTFEQLPATGGFYWAAMLAAGIFGTVAGDVASHALGGGTASLVLGAMLAGALAWGRGRGASLIGIYWLTVAVARTAGTAIGDWLAESKALDLGLLLASVMTASTFVALLLVWRSRRGHTQAQP